MEPLQLTLERAFCTHHFEPFKTSDWPNGAERIYHRMLGMLVKMEQTVEEAHALAGVPAEVPLEPKTLELVFDVKPMCCRLNKRQLIRIYEDAKVGKIGWCSVCRKRRRQGVKLQTTNGLMPHVCFTCLLNATIRRNEQ